MKRIYALLLIAAFGFVASTQAQNVTTNSGSGLNATYSDLASAITALNAATISSPVTITLTAAETAPAGGYVITASGTSTNTITISGGGNTVTASAAHTAGSVSDAIFKLVGADYITLQNFTMQENASNTTTTVASNNKTEFGVALFYATTTDGAQNNTIQNNTISLTRTYLNTFGIFSTARQSSTGIVAGTTTAADATTSAGSNSFNKVYGNSISNVNYGVVLIGSAVVAAMDNGNDVGGTSASTGNTITNWGFGGATGTTYLSLTANNYCIFDLQQVNENVSYNTITSATVASAVTEGGFLKNFASAPTSGTYTTTINNNTVTITSNPTATGTSVIGLNNQGLSTLLSTYTMSMNNNVVQNCTLGGSTATTNTITGLTNLSLPGTINMTGNTVTGCSITATSSTSGGVSGITNSGGAGTVNITGNSIINCSNASSSSTANLIGISNSGAAGTVNINSNILRSLSSTSTGQMQGIINTGAIVTALNVNNNQLGNATSGYFTSSVATSGALFGVVSAGATSTCAVTIQGNDIRGITYNSTIASSQNYINVQGTSPLSINISSNTFTNLVANTTSSVVFISASVVMPAGGSQTITNNSIVTGFNKTGAGGLVRFYSSTSTSPSTVTKTITGNNFSNITLTGATQLDGFLDTDGASASNAPTKTIDNNTVNNVTGGNPVTGLINIDKVGGTSSVSSNTITNVSADGGATAIAVAANGNATTLNVNSNIINTISSTQGGDVIGISNANGSTTVNISLNTIHTLSTIGTTNAATGIANTGGAGTVINIFKNKVYNLNNTGVATSTPAVNGVLISGGNAVNTYNNLIGDLKAASANSTDAIRGISVTSTATAVYNVYFNTVYITGTSSGTNFGTSGIYHAASSVAGTATLALRNNIIYNNVTPKGTGLAVAFRRSTGAAGDLNNYASSSNNNDFYAGTPSASKLIYSDGTSTAQTIAAYTAGVFTAGTIAPRDAASISEDPEFQSVVGSSVDFLKFKTTSPKQIEKGGAPITGYTTDYAGTTRNASNPDIGAWELAGISADQVPPTVTVTSANYACNGGANTVTATITDASGVPQTGANVPVLYWKTNAGSYNGPVQATYGSGVYSFAGVGSGSAIGDVISYYIVAQDALGNVAATPSTGAVVTANPPLSTTPPTTPSTYTNLGTINAGTYTVGAGGDYATLTAAIGAYNSSCLGGNITFNLTDATYTTPAETFPIVITGRGTSSAQLTIKPATGVTSAITGSTATGEALIKLNGADYVTIAGSLTSNTTRDLTISNTSTAANTAAIWVSSTGTGAGATNNVIRNINISAGSNSVTSTFGVYAGGTSISTSGTGDDNNTLTIKNNVISKAYYGIYAVSTAAGQDQDLLISNNFIGAPAAGSTAIGFTGILLGQLKNPIIAGNTVTNISGTVAAPRGIQVNTGVIGAAITENNISNIQYTGTSGSAGIGISITGTTGSGSTIANNMIYGVLGDGNGANIAGANPFGIAITGGSGYNVYYNSVWMYGNRPSNAFTNAVSAGLYIGAATTSLDIRNNIFSNTMTSSNASAGSNYGIYSASANTAFTSIDYNDYYAVSTTAGITKAVGFLGSNQLTINAWRTATGKDVNSFSGDPQFISQTNLHINNAVPTQVESAGVAIGAVTTDFDGDTRNATTPDVGADELNAIALTCFVPTAVTATPTFGSTGITWTAPTQGTPTGYQWEIRTAGFGGTGATGLAATGNTTAPTTSATVTTLSPQTTYTLYLRTDCGSGDFSQWVQGNSFTTPCNLIVAPFVEGFNSPTIPNCWTTQNVSGTYASPQFKYLTINTEDIGPNGIISTLPYEGTRMVQYNAWDIPAGNSQRLVSAPITTSGIASGLKVQFMWRNLRDDGFTAPTEGMQVQYSLDGTNWTDVPSGFFTRHDATIPDGTAAWKQKTAALPAAAHNQPLVYIGFKFTSAFGYNMHMDAAGVVQQCTTSPTPPTNMTYPVVGITTLSGSFTPSNADGYLVVIYPSGSTPTAPVNGTQYNTGDVLGSGSVLRYSSFTTFTASGLAPSTAYDVYAYPFNYTSCYGGPFFGTTPLISTVSTSSCTGPVPTAINIGPGQTYTNLTTFIPVLTACGVQGNTVVSLNPDYDPTTETYPLSFNAIGTGATAASASQTVTIRPSAAVTSTISLNTSASPVIELDGAKYLTIDGRINGNGSTRSIDIVSTGSGEAITLLNDAQNNALEYLNITSGNTSSTSGIITIAGTTGTGASNGNSNNLITFCGINGNGSSPNGIWASGSAAPADNKSNTISNNDIYDYYFNTAGVNNVGIYLAGNNAVTPNTNWTISGNSFYQTASRSYSNMAEPDYIAAVAADFSPRGAYNITGNYFGGSAPQAGGSAWTGTSGGTGTYIFQPIYLFDNTSTATNITNNTITNLNISSLSTSFGGFNGISLHAGSGTISNNVIGSATVPGSITLTIGTGTTASVGTGMFLGSGTANTATSINVTNNTIAGVTVQGTSVTTPAGFIGVLLGSAVTFSAASNITGNTIGTASAGIVNPSTGAVGNTLRGISSSNAGTFNISNNTVTNISTAATGASQLIGILAQSGTNTINNNTVSNISAPTSTTSVTGGVVGILNTSTLATLQTIRGNSISALRGTSTAGSSVYVSGIVAGSTASSGEVSKNQVWDLTNTCTGVNGLITGFIPASNAASGTWTISNNMISLTNASNVNNVRVAGIMDSITGGTRKYYFNSIYIGGSSAGTLPSYAFYRAYQATTSTIDVQNNLLVNTRTSTGPNYAIANRATTVPPTTGWTSNYNVLNAPDPNKIGCWGPTGPGGDKTFAAWRIITSGVGSYSGIPVTFVDPTTADLHLNMGANSTPIESGGAVGTTGITDDIDGQTRPGGGGTSNGGGTAADIGADEFNGKPLDIDMGAIAVAVPSGGCFTSSQTISIRIKNYGGTLIGFTNNPVTVSGTIVSPSSASTPFNVVVSTGVLNPGQTLDVDVLTGYNMSAAGNYVIDATATVAGDENNGNDAMPTVTKTSTAVAAGTISSPTLGYCGTSGKPTFTLTGSTGGDIQWQSSTTAAFTTPVNVGTLNSTTYTTVANVPAGTTYFRAVTSCGATSLPSNVIAITFSNPTISTSNKTRCGTGTVTLTATPSSGSTVIWYNSATGGVPRATGTSFTTLSLTADTSYYVTASSSPLDKVGISPTGSTCGTITTTATTDQVLRFNTTAPVTLVSAYVVPAAQGAFTVALRAAGSSTNLQLYSTAFSLSQVGIPQQLPLNFVIPTAGNYQLSNVTGGSAQISSGYSCGYPKNNTSGTFSIVGSATSSTGTLSTTTYNSFYDLIVADGSYCESPRQQVNVTVSTPPALALDASSVTVCSGGSGTTVHVTAGTVGNYTIYKWSPTTGAAAGGNPNGRDLLVNPASNTTYTLTASGGGPNGQCINTAKVSVAVVPIPATPTVTPVTICAGGTSTAMTIGNAVTAVTSPGAPSSGNQAVVTFTNTAGDEGGSFAAGKVIGTFTLPTLPAGAVITKGGFDIPGIVLLAGNNGSSIRLGIKTPGNANVTTTGYQGATTGTTPNPVTYSSTTADQTTIASVIPIAGGTFNVIYYSSLNNNASAQDVTFPATGSFFYEYTVPVTYNWYTSQYGATPIATGTSFNPVGVAGSGITNNTTPASAKFWVTGVAASLCPTARTSTPTTTYTVGARPTVTFTAAPGATSCQGVSVTYTTQPGMTSYVWVVPGVLNTDYQVTGGGTGATSNTVTLKWLTAGSKTVTVNYNNANGCNATTPASNTTTIGNFAAPTVNIAGNATTCFGAPVTYTATPTPAGTYSYQWKKAGSNVGTNSATYVDPGTTAGTVQVVVTSTTACASGAQATSNTITLAITPNQWTGSLNNDFNNKNNWCAGVVPTGAANVMIPSSAPTMPRLTGTVTVNDVDIASGAYIDLNGYAMTIAGALTGSGNFKGFTGYPIANDYVVKSTLNFTKASGSIGTLNMDPSAKGLGVLNVTGSTTIALGNALDLYDSVDVNNATLTTNDNLTLKSVQSTTGRIGEINGGGDITGNVTVERWLRNLSRKAWRLLSVPVQGAQTINQAWQEGQAALANGNPGYGTILTSTTGVSQGYDAVTTYNSLLKWDPVTASFQSAGPTSGPIATTGGYYVYIMGDRSVTPSSNATTTTTLREKGPLYKKTLSTENFAANQIHVVGNLYASAIDITELQQTSTGLTAFSVWDPALSSSSSATTTGGALQTFSAANLWQAVPGGGTYAINPVNTRVESGQAFVISPTSPVAITFTENAKTTGSKQSMRMSAVISRVKANLYAVVNKGNNTLVDGNVTVFDNSYSAGADNYDVLKMPASSESFGISNGGKSLVIDARPVITSTDVINYSLANAQPQKQYMLEFTSENLDPSLTAYLVDSYLKKETPVALNATQTVQFTITADPESKNPNRFKLVFKLKSSLPIASNVKDGMNGKQLAGAKAEYLVSPNPVQDGNITVQFVNQPEGRYNIRLYNGNGQVVYSRSVDHTGKSSSNRVSFSSTLTGGLYKLEIVQPNKQRYVQNLMVSNAK